MCFTAHSDASARQTLTSQIPPINPANPLTISSKSLKAVIDLAKDPRYEYELIGKIRSLPPEEQFDLLALVILSRPGTKAYNVARKSAGTFPVEQVAGYLTGLGAKLVKALQTGRKIHRRQA